MKVIFINSLLTGCESINTHITKLNSKLEETKNHKITRDNGS